MSTYNVILAVIKMTALLNIYLESIYDLLVNLHFVGNNISIFEKSVEVSILTEDVFTIGISKWIDLVLLVPKNIYEIMI